MGSWAARAVTGFILEGMRPVCFLSDFGLADDFVGTCKGVIISIAPGASVLDLTHEVPGFEVEAGAEILQHATRYMPGDAVYLAVVDPGVGTQRRAIALRTESGAFLVGPGRTTGSWFRRPRRWAASRRLWRSPTSVTTSTPFRTRSTAATSSRLRRRTWR